MYVHTYGVPHTNNVVGQYISKEAIKKGRKRIFFCNTVIGNKPDDKKKKTKRIDKENKLFRFYIYQLVIIMQLYKCQCNLIGYILLNAINLT